MRNSFNENADASLAYMALFNQFLTSLVYDLVWNLHQSQEGYLGYLSIKFWASWALSRGGGLMGFKEGNLAPKCSFLAS